MNYRLVVAFAGALCLVAVIGYAVVFRPISPGAEPPTSSTQDPIIAEMISKINETEIYNSVYDLQNFTTREYGTDGNVNAGTYLYNRLGNISRLSVEFQGGSYRNVVATLAGADPASTATYIVGAHYDSKSSDPANAPGATDDGGGVAIVLELARIMSHYRFQDTLKFAFWNDEEDGLYGSTDYAHYASNNGLNISLYFNYDSSCYDPDNRFVLDIMYDSHSSWVKDVMTEHNTLYAIGFSLTYNVHTCSSDHLSFRNNGYTAVMTHAETHGPAHSPEDTIEKVSTLYAKKNGQLGMSVLAELSRVSDATKIYSTSFEDASVKDSQTLNLYNGLKNNVHVQGGGLFWVEDSINPTSGAPPPHTGTKSIGLRCPAGTGTRRSELMVTHIDESSTLSFPGREAYFSVWYFLPSDWKLDGLGYNWYSIFNPFVLYADGGLYPRTEAHIHKIDGTDDVYDLTMEYDTSSSGGWHNVLGRIDNFQVPRGVWFQMKWYIFRSTTNGLLKCWINAPPIYNNVLWVDVQPSYGLKTDVVGNSAWLTSIAKIYTSSETGGTTADLSLWVDDLEVWNGEPAGLIWLPYQDTTVLDTKRSTANAGNGQTVNKDLLVAFDASAFPSQNDIKSYTWPFTDVTPQTLTGKNPTYTFNTLGTITKPVLGYDNIKQ